MNNKLEVNISNRKTTIDVKETVFDPDNQKKYLIYSIDNINNDAIYVSKIIESENGVSLEEVNQDEFAFLQDKIEKYLINDES